MTRTPDATDPSGGTGGPASADENPPRLGTAAFDLSGRTAVLAGAGSAMGLAGARALASAGASLVLGDLRTDAIAALADELRGAGGRVEWTRCDVTRPADLEALVARAVERFGRLDVMANWAGVIHDADVVDTAEADLDRVLAVNLKGVFFGCQAAARVMAPRRRGRIVNMASSAAFTATAGLSAYSISKSGVVALTRVLAAELGPHGVHVNAIAPGYVEGGMTWRRALRADGSLDPAALAESRERARRRSPLRVLGEPEDVANALLYLASDASRYLTGQVIHANGGAHMP